MSSVDGKKVKLVLEDGSVFEGLSFGYFGSSSGEVVFNTGMTGYPETFTDPSYCGQILVMTYPLIGNYGIPCDERTEDGILKNFESENIHPRGIVVSDYCDSPSHWSCVKTLHQWLEENKIPGIYGIDTRALTKKIREKGAMLGKITAENGDSSSKNIEGHAGGPHADGQFYNPNEENLAAKVSIKEPRIYKRGKKTVMLVDCGVKNNIIREFLKRDITVIRVPWDYDICDSPYNYNGLFLSNGPGDPKQCKATIANIRKAMEKNIPIFGICLGNQILALAAGADTYKLKFGHRSQNQPCLRIGTKKAYITSQNHGFSVRSETLRDEWEEIFVNSNDGTNEGIRHKTKPFMSCQFHPESWPGPNDTNFLFDEFIKLLK